MRYRDVVLHEVFFEIRRIGRAIKVVAIDPVTGIEVSMVGAPGYSDEALKRFAARKLAYVIWKKKNRAERS